MIKHSIFPYYNYSRRFFRLSRKFYGGFFGLREIIQLGGGLGH